MLIKCPECDLQVSDKAISCPHCGFVVDSSSIQVKRPKKSKAGRMRLPNGFGQITELKNNRLRNPYRAMVTVGKTPEGRPICKILKPKGYFKTYNEAYEALIEYHKNPYDLKKDITIVELYEKWSKEYFKTLSSTSSMRTIECAWRYCTSIYKMRTKDIRARHIKDCMENGYIMNGDTKRFASASIKSRIKSLFNLMMDYALEYELVERNYARTFNISKDIIVETERSKRGHLSFKDEEIDKLWNNIENINIADIILIQCYSGWRPQELGLIKLEDVDLENGWFKGGIKTSAGKNRIVPIHSKIKDLVERRYKEAENINSEYLFNVSDAKTHKNSSKLTYDKYRHRFESVVKKLELNPDHRAHDPRKHFITLAKKYNVDEYAIKYIVGHSISDITEKVYTERNKEWLKTEIEKIK